MQSPNLVIFTSQISPKFIYAVCSFLLTWPSYRPAPHLNNNTVTASLFHSCSLDSLLYTVGSVIFSKGKSTHITLMFRTLQWVPTGSKGSLPSSTRKIKSHPCWFIWHLPASPDFILESKLKVFDHSLVSLASESLHMLLPLYETPHFPNSTSFVLRISAHLMNVFLSTYHEPGTM